MLCTLKKPKIKDPFFKLLKSFLSHILSDGFIFIPVFAIN